MRARTRSSFLNSQSAGASEGPRIDVGPRDQQGILMGKSGFGNGSLSERQSTCNEAILLINH